MLIRNSVALLWLTLIVACTAVGIQAPKSFDQHLVYAYGTHTSVLEATANALEAGALTVEDSEAVLQLADQSRTLLDAARVASGGGDVTTAEGRLALATNVLEQLLAYLRTRGVK